MVSEELARKYGKEYAEAALSNQLNKLSEKLQVGIRLVSVYVSSRSYGAGVSKVVAVDAWGSIVLPKGSINAWGFISYCMYSLFVLSMCFEFYLLKH